MEVSIGILNSCESESHRVGDHFGCLSEKQTQSLLDYWQTNSTNLLRVVVFHHNPFPFPDETIVKEWKEFLSQESKDRSPRRDFIERFAGDFVPFRGREFLNALAEEAHVSLVLHGHSHSNDANTIAWRRHKGTTHVLSAGSLGLVPHKLPKYQPNAVQLVLLDRESKEIRAWRLIYEAGLRPKGKVSAGYFAPDGVHPEGYRQDLWVAKSKKPSTKKKNSAPSLVGKNINETGLRRRYMPSTCQAITHSFDIAGRTGVITVGLYDDGQPGELMLRADTSGSTSDGLASTIGIFITLLLQHGYSVKRVAEKMTGIRFEPSGFTRNPDIPYARSILDYVGRWLLLTFCETKEISCAKRKQH